MLYEVRGSKIRSSEILLVPKEELGNYRGFRSVYGFPEATAEIIKEQGGTRGLNGCELFADDLLLDFDDNEAAANAARSWLEQCGLQHSVWDSGGRSIHIHIDTPPKRGLMVSRNHKKFVSRYFAGADLSFYHWAGMYRLPGTLHESNPGRFKRLLHESKGQLLNINDFITEFEIDPTSLHVTNNRRSQEESERMLMYLGFKQIGKGGRNKHVYIMARLCMDLGYTFNKTCEVVNMWNESACQPPLPASELHTAVSSAFKARSQSCG